MKNYLMIDSQGSFEAASTADFFALACDLKRQGGAVEIMLVQNGVMAARAGAKDDALSLALKAGVQVLADDLSMRERALSNGVLARGVKPAPISTVVERMAAGWNVIWH